MLFGELALLAAKLMKINFRFRAVWLGLAAFFIAIYSASAQRSQIGILFEYYEVELAEIPAMLREYADQPDASEMVALLRARADKGEVRLAESGYVLTRSGQRAKIESMREWIYPTEFDPPEIPQKLTGPIEPGVVLSTNANPTAFEQRSVGAIFEVDPVQGAGDHYVELNVAPELVEYRGEKIWGADEAVTKQPIFRTAEVTTSLVLGKGASEMLGVFAMHKDSTKRLLGFVTPMVNRAIDRKTHENPPEEPAEAEEAPANDDPFGGGESADDDPFGDGGGKPAAEDAITGPEQVSLVTEFIEMNALAANKFILAIDEISDVTAQRAKLNVLIEKGEARIVDINTIVTRSGQRAKAGAIEEFIYPTEYDPPEIPQELSGPIEAGVDFRTSNGATAFETRHVGTSVEVDPVLAGDGSVIDVNIAPEIVKFVRNLEHGSVPGATSQPLFETIKLTTAATVPTGTTVLLGMHSLETARAAEAATAEERAEITGRRVLVFLTADRKMP